MSYTITITFPEEQINSVDLYQFILTFTINLTAANQNYTSSEKKLVITNHGKLQWHYDVQDPLLVPGMLDIEIGDKDGYLDTLLFGIATSESLNLDHRFKVEIKINGATEFIGVAQEDSIRLNEGAKLIRFTASPETDIINKRMVYGANNEFLDPFDYTLGNTVNISNATYASGEVTVTHASDSSFNVGNTVKIEGVVGMTDINGSHIITAETSSTQFKIAVDANQTYVSGGTATNIIGSSHRGLIAMLEDIFQLVDSSITFASGKLDFIHNWEFNAGPTNLFTISNATHSGGVVTITHSNDPGGVLDPGDQIMIEGVVGMTDLNGIFTIASVLSSTQLTVSLTTVQTYTSGGTIKVMLFFNFDDNLFQDDQPLYFDASRGIRNLGDVLKQLAIDWFCFTGMIHRQKAFFRKLFFYDGSNLQTLGMILNKQKEYRYGLLDYVQVQTNISLTHKYTAGVFTELEGRALVRDDILPGFWVDYNAPVELSGSNVRYFDGASNPFIISAKDPGVENNYNSYYANGHLLAQLWFNFRGNIRNCRVDKFIVSGITYDFFKNFTNDSVKYQIIGMMKDFEQNITEIEAIFLGSV